MRDLVNGFERHFCSDVVFMWDVIIFMCVQHIIAGLYCTTHIAGVPPIQYAIALVFRVAYFFWYKCGSWFFLVFVGVRWVMLSFLVLVTVFMGHGGCVVCLVSFFPTFVQEVVVFVSFFGFFPFVVIVGVVRMGGVVLICAGRGCR